MSTFSKRISIFCYLLWASIYGVQAQTPGGVTTNYTWHAWLTPETYSNGLWTNKISSGIGNFYAPETAPVKVNGGYNYHPSVQFISSDNKAINRMISEKPYVINKNDNFTVLIVVKRQGHTDTYDYLLSFDNNDGSHKTLMWYNDKFHLNWPTGTDRDFPGFTEGIFAFDNSNNDTDDGIASYINGVKNTQASGKAGSNSANDNLTIGSGEIDSHYGFEGVVQELIVLKANGAGNHINATDLQKIHSYLAIKYGITLNEGHSNYVNSAGTAVWNDPTYRYNIFGIGRDNASGLYQKQSHSATNQGITVFLGSQLTALNSQNNGTLDNGQFLVMGMSSNDNGTESYNCTKNTTYQNGTTLADDLTFRSKQVYKAQLTGIPSGNITVNFKVDRADFFYVLVSTGLSFDPGTTKAYPIVNGVAQGVEIGGGAGTPYRYITFAGHATSPGGVDIDKLRLWLDADVSGSFTLSPRAKESTAVKKYGDYEKTGTGTSTSLTEIPAVQEWKDLTRNITYQYTGKDNMPVYRNDQVEMNYHPSVHFWGASGSEVAYLKNYSPLIQTQRPSPDSRHTAIFVVNNAPPRSDNRSYYMGFGHNTSSNSADYGGYDPDYGIQVKGGITYTIMNTHADEQQNSGDANPKLQFKTGATSVVAYRTYIPNGGTNASNANIIFNIDGQKSSSVPVNMGGSNINMNKASTLGISFSSARQLRGLMSEVLIFEDTVSTADLKKIESYLAIKYGVTLNESPSVNYNYQFSDGHTYWPGKSAKYRTYHNNVSAVIRDDAARLHNRQSHSTGAGSLLHIGVAGSRLGEDIEDIGDLENNMEAVVWGSNGASGATTHAGEHCGEFQFVFNRKWIVRKWTQNDRPVQLLIGAQNNASKTIGGSDPGDAAYYAVLNGTTDVAMLIADSLEKLDPANPKFLTNGAQVVPMDYVGGENQCNYLLKDTVAYVTFAYKPTLKGCVSDVEFTGGNKQFKWLSTKEQWGRQNYGSATSITKPAVNLGDDITVTTKVEYSGGVVNPSGYPHAVNTPTGGSLKINRRRGTTGSAVTVTINFSYPVIPSFSLSDIDGWNGAFEKVEIIGKCEKTPYYPQLSYAHKAGESGSWYRITSVNTAQAQRKSDLSERNPAGRLNVEFTGGVTEVKIIYTIEAKINSSVTNHLFISPITIKQTPPSPMMNEHGLAFTKDVKLASITTCENPEYSFEITNTNCESKTLIFHDTLPEGLKWNLNLLTFDALNQSNTNLVVEDFDASGRHVLKIAGLEILGSTKASIIAPAIFSPGAVPQDGNKTFNNHACIEYALNEGTFDKPVYVDHMLFSEDKYKPGNRETSFTATQEQQYSTIEVDYSLSPLRYIEEDTVEFTITAKNVNTPMTNMVLDIFWKYGDYYKFAYIPNSFVALNESGKEIKEIMLATDVTPQNNISGVDTVPWLLIAGSKNGATGFTLPQGTTTFKFRMKAPKKEDLTPASDDLGYTIPGAYEPLIVNYAFSADSDDPCVQASMKELSGDIIVPYDLQCTVALQISTNIIIDTAICLGSDLVIRDSLLIEDCTFGNDLSYIWEFRQKGSSVWTALEADNGTIMDCSSENKADKIWKSSRSITSAQKSDEGYYRLTVRSQINNNTSCSAKDSVYVRIKGNVIPDANGIVYVKEGSTGDGSSWANAYPNLADPLADAKTGATCDPIKEIWVAKGTYYPKYAADFDAVTPSTDSRDKAFVLVEGVKIYGGFAGGETSISQRQTTVNEHGVVQMKLKTVLSGDIDKDGTITDNAYHIVIAAGEMIKNADTARLDGFTVTGGNANGTGTVEVNTLAIGRTSGGGMVVYTAAPVITNDSIAGNSANGEGGGAYIYFDSNPVFTNTVIKNNTATSGGGVYVYESSGAKFTRTVISNNVAAVNGGGVFAGIASTPEFTNTVISGNTAAVNGGGVCVDNSSCIFINTLVSGNTAGNNSYGGGVYLTNNGTADFTNATIAGNYAPRSGGVYNNSGTLVLKNTIVYNNTNGTTVGTYTAEYSLVESETLTGTDNFPGTTDPLFVFSAPAVANTPTTGGNYRLPATSLVVDKGGSPNSEPYDLDGNARIQGKIDLGAYETEGVSESIQAVRDSASTIVSTPVIIGVLANDNRGSCVYTPLSAFDTVAGSGLHHGTLKILDIDSTFVYTPADGYYGVDSIAYEIGCNGNTSTGWVYMLTSNPLSKNYRACAGATVVLGFRDIEDVRYEWYDDDSNLIPSSTDSTMTVTMYSGATETYYAQPVWHGIKFPSHTVTLNPAYDLAPPVRDIRIELCPTPARPVYLTSYLDSLDYYSAVEWSKVSASTPSFANTSTGELNSGEFIIGNTYTYRYTRRSECGNNPAVAKAYVHVPRNKIPRRLDTVLICVSVTDVVNINSLFGLKLGGQWHYDNIVSANVATSPSQHVGALFFDVKTTYQQATYPAYGVNYRGVTGKAFVFEYDYSSSDCTNGKTTIVIVAYE